MGATLKILGNIDKKVVSGQRRGVIRQLYKKGRLPMKLSHTGLELHTAAFDRLKIYIQQPGEQFGEESHNFERFEEELHALIMAVEGELVGEELDIATIGS